MRRYVSRPCALRPSTRRKDSSAPTQPNTRPSAAAHPGETGLRQRRGIGGSVRKCPARTPHAPPSELPASPLTAAVGRTISDFFTPPTQAARGSGGVSERQESRYGTDIGPAGAQSITGVPAARLAPPLRDTQRGAETHPSGWPHRWRRRGRQTAKAPPRPRQRQPASAERRRTRWPDGRRQVENTAGGREAARAKRRELLAAQ